MVKSRRVTSGIDTAPDDGSFHLYATVWMWFTHEARERRTHLPPLAHPRAHPGLPAGGRVGAADTGRPGRLPSTGAGDRLGRPGARLPPRRPRALDDPMEGRGAPRLGRPECRPRLQGAHPPRPVAGGSA